ncbi:type II toxin-antitoxin system YafQ family toxin [Streptococcus sp. NLN64]|uniref:type II toxin-antitoxin system YafQ family toxin n=1 Tax=Streptococcus sp. NLN64 TaxID=2822799 RepID=UPI001B355D80|nr:type II toxin-antitoxin system YafQ family toxin [Streptococcus sp. NLN64]
MEAVLSKLQQEIELDKKYLDHPLKGNYQGFRECHIEPDWLLIYAIDRGHLILTATRTGNHSDLF